MAGQSTATHLHDLVATDLRHIWHPFVQAQTDGNPIPIERGEGTLLFDIEGTPYIDAMSSWWVNLHGHAHPHIAGRIAEQAHRLEHAQFADLTHQPACELAVRLLKHLPSNLTRVFYSDNGSTAVEAALKIAMQYWYNLNPDSPRTKVVSFKHGYHGDTVGAMSVSERSLFSKPFAPLMFNTTFVDPPEPGNEQTSLLQLAKALEADDVACFIYEPLLQGTGGFRRHTAEGLNALLSLCKQNNVITIADEVLTGFGRLGPLFVSSTMEQQPDIICLAKGMAGGFLPLAATICSEKIYEAFLAPERHKALLHGHTYCANPLGCVAALASMDLIENPLCEKQREGIHQQHLAFVEVAKNHPKLQRCEAIGTLLVLEYATNASYSYYGEHRNKLAKYFLDNRILTRPFGNLVHILPPYCITKQELATVYEVLLRSLEEVV